MGHEKLRLQLDRQEERMWNEDLVCMWSHTVGQWSKEKKQHLWRCNAQKKLGLVQHPLSNTLWSCNICWFLRRYTALKKCLVFPQCWFLQAVSGQGFPEFVHIPAQGVSTVWRSTMNNPGTPLTLLCDWKETWPRQERRLWLLSEEKHRHNDGAWKVLCFHHYFS